MKIIIFLVGLFSSISLLSQDFECYSDDNTFPNIYNSTSCSSWESYVPKLTTWDSFKDLTVKVNFHFFRRSDGSGTYQPPFTDRCEDMINTVNQIFNNLDSPTLAVIPTVEELPESKIRFEVQGVYLHDSSDYYIGTMGDYSRFLNFAVNPECEINIFYFYTANQG